MSEPDRHDEHGVIFNGRHYGYALTEPSKLTTPQLEDLCAALEAARRRLDAREAAGVGVGVRPRPRPRPQPPQQGGG